jgi:hypothetical protein
MNKEADMDFSPHSSCSFSRLIRSLSVSRRSDRATRRVQRMVGASGGRAGRESRFIVGIRVHALAGEGPIAIERCQSH